MRPTTPTTNLADGQRVTINLKSNADVAINQVQIRECRFGVAYTSDAQTLPGGGNCPSHALSTAGSENNFVSKSASNGLTALARTPQGATVSFRVGSGVVDWGDAAGTTLTCDASHPCALVVELSIGAATVFQVLKLAFTDNNPLAACGGTATGALTTAGSDELADAWSAWTRDVCARTGRGAPTLISFSDPLGESGDVTQFARGELDVAYTTAGYDDQVGLTTVPASKRRTAVAIPLALNASVVAAGGGQHQLLNGIALGDYAPYADGSLELTAGEIGALLGGGQAWVSRLDLPYQGSILGRNPALNQILYAPDAGVEVPARALASTWFLTRYLSTLAPNDFINPTVSPAVHRGPTKSFASGYDVISPYTGRPALQKVTVAEANAETDGPVWSVTDLASARALGLTPVALTGASGFIAPNAATLNAAVAAMKPDAGGMLVPDPTLATNPASARGYPLTYVIYALVPAEPLVDTATCHLRTTSQALLTSWLHYVTTDGQKILPAGLEPLPASLAAQARAALSQVGASTVTGTCAGRTGTGSHAGGGAGSGGGGAGGSGTAAGTSTTGTIGGGSFLGDSSAGALGLNNALAGYGNGGTGGLGASRAVRLADAVDAKTKVDKVDIPPFSGRRLLGPFGALLALVAIAMMTALAAWITASGLLRPISALRIGLLAVLWTSVAIAGIGLVVFELGPTLQQRDQRSLLARYKVAVSNAAGEASTPFRASTPTTPPELGSPTGILEVGALKSQNVVVEGVGASQTREGPGHVPGTAGLGQPGNSVVVARRNGYGGAFARIGHLRAGDRIVATTTQGQSVYRVSAVHERNIGSSTRLDRLYGPTTDDRLTILTSASRAPWDTSEATVVVARLIGKPFSPTPQGARSNHENGLHGDGGLSPSLFLAVLVLAGGVAGSVALYRTMRFRTAYILTVAPLVALTVVLGETVSRLLPAWT